MNGSTVLWLLGIIVVAAIFLVAAIKKYSSQLTNNKDAISAASSFFSMVAIIFGVVQFWQAKELLQTQTLLSALSNARAIIAQAERNPAPVAKIYGVQEAEVAQKLYINKVVSLYSEQFISHEKGILNEEYWGIFKRELCSFYNLQQVKPQIDSQIVNDAYPRSFANVFEECETS